MKILLDKQTRVPQGHTRCKLYKGLVSVETLELIQAVADCQLIPYDIIITLPQATKPSLLHYSVKLSDSSRCSLSMLSSTIYI